MDDFDYEISQVMARPALRAGAPSQPAAQQVAQQENKAIPREINLDGYHLVDRAKWYSIPIRTHIRYEGVDGKIRSGGFLQNKYDQDGKQMFYVENGFDARAPKYAKWPVVLSNVAKIWTKADIPNTVPSDTVEDLKRELFQVTNRLTILETKYNKLVSFITSKFSTQQQRVI